MQTTTITPWWRRGPIVAIAVFALIVGAGAVIVAAGADSTGDVAGGGGEIAVPSVSVTTAPPTTTTTTAVLQPHDHALGLWAARYGPDADPAVWRSFLSVDSPALDPIEWVWLDDFDGDGVVALADWIQFKIALNGAMGTSAEFECETVSEDTARCVVSNTDAFYELGGTDPAAKEVLMTFEDGKLVNEDVAHFPVAAQLQNEEANDEYYPALIAYEAWVQFNYPSRYPSLFEPPCCEAWITLPSAVPEHEELMAEYLDSMASG